MPPNREKGKGRARQTPQPQPQPSDYDTDAPQIDVSRLPPPRSNEELNLRVVRRHYPEVTAIRHVTSYVVLYLFSLETQEWTASEKQGTMFVCELTPSSIGADRFAVIILNRRGLENFQAELTDDEAIMMQGDYLMLQDERVYGLWIFAEEPPSSTANARTDTTEKILELAKKAKESRQAKEQERKIAAPAAEQVAESVPMGRQLSLRELFGRQRTQDSGWSVQNHQNQPLPPPILAEPSSSFAPTPSPVPFDGVLGQLFMKAKQDYNGVG